MKINLAENLLRFAPKNLDAKTIKKIQSLAEQQNTNVPATQGQSASLPAQLLLNYDNGLLRAGILYEKGDYIYDTNATFVGSSAGLTLKNIVLVNETEQPITIPLVKPFTVPTPLDFANGLKNQQMFNNGIKLDINSPGAKAVTAAHPTIDSFKLSSWNNNLGAEIYSALSNVAAAKGWYTGPNQPVAKQYAIFTNHNGKQDIS